MFCRVYEYYAALKDNAVATPRYAIAGGYFSLYALIYIPTSEPRIISTSD